MYLWENTILYDFKQHTIPTLSKGYQCVNLNKNNWVFNKNAPLRHIHDVKGSTNQNIAQSSKHIYCLWKKVACWKWPRCMFYGSQNVQQVDTVLFKNVVVLASLCYTLRVCICCLSLCNSEGLHLWPWPCVGLDGMSCLVHNFRRRVVVYDSWRTTVESTATYKVVQKFGGRGEARRGARRH